MRVSWWLDEGALPEFLWARLSVLDSGDAEVLDLDGKIHTFGSAEEAKIWLREDEYMALDDLVDEGSVPATTQPPAWPRPSQRTK